MSKKAIIATSVTVGVLALLGVFIWLGGAQFIKATLVYGRTFSFFFLIMLVTAGLCVLFGTMSYRRYEYSYSGNSKTGSSVFFGLLSGAVGLGFTVLLIVLATHVGYDSARFYISSAETSDTSKNATPDFEQRAPYDVAVAGASNNMGSTSGTAQSTKSVADGPGDGLWNTLIVRQGIGVGYEAVQTVETPLYGTVVPADVNFCEFDTSKAPLRFGGALVQNNLNRVLDWSLPFDVTFDSNDSYGYCAEDGTPYLVQPLKQMNGWYAAYETPYGVLTMNGKTGEFRTITDSDEIAKIPGSTYPMSLAITQRESLNAQGSLEDYLWGSVGYTLSIYGGNASEFQLVNSDTEKVNYVTPVSPRGDSSSVVALTTVNAKSFKPGVLNTIDVYLVKQDKGSASFETKMQDIKNEYRNLLAFANGDIGIYEIVPGKDNSWIASIGSGQGTIYRAVITAEGEITLYNAEGDAVSKTAINGESNTDGTDTGEVPTDTNGNIDLSTLTPEQLRELGKQIIDELADRNN